MRPKRIAALACIVLGSVLASPTPGHAAQDTPPQEDLSWLVEAWADPNDGCECIYVKIPEDTCTVTVGRDTIVFRLGCEGLE